MRLPLCFALLSLFAACSKPSGGTGPAPARAVESSPRAAALPMDRSEGPKLPPEAAEKAKALGERMQKEPRSFEAASSLGELYYDHARYPEAVDAYGQAIERAQETLALLEELAARKSEQGFGPTPPHCTGSEADAVEALAGKARAQRDSGRLPAAFACARQAAQPVLVAMSRRANALFLLGNVDQALAGYEGVLQRDPDMPEALFFAGALSLNRRGAGLPERRRAQRLWRRYLEVAPEDHPHRAEVEKGLPQLEQALAQAAAQPEPPAPGARAEGAAGLPAGHPPVPGPGAMRGGGDGHPRVEGAPPPENLDVAIDQAESALARGDGPTAARLYMGAMNGRPDDGRVQAGLAASQFLKGSAMAEHVFKVAATRDPKAVDELAQRLRAKGNAGLARTLLQQLVVAAPEYSEKAQVKQRAR